MKPYKNLLLVFITIGAVNIVAILALFSIVRISSHHEWKQTFSSCKSDFELVNEYVLSVCSNNEMTSDSFFSISFENQKASTMDMYLDDSFHSTEILLEDEVKAALDNIVNNAMVGNFDSIKVTPDRIIYYGLGLTFYVYSRDGTKVKYLFSPDKDEGHYNLYILNDNWYLFDYS